MVVRGRRDPLRRRARRTAAPSSQTLRPRPDVAERVGAAIGLIDATFPLHEIYWAARKFFEALAARRPLVALVDDIHWAEAAFLDLLDTWSTVGRARRSCLLCSSRHDLLEEHPEWGEETADRSARSARAADGGRGRDGREPARAPRCDERVRNRIIEAAEGNPLYVEQMLSMLMDDGALRRDEDGRWIVPSDVGAITIPPTISALLTARLDRLGATERTVIERGAVIGQVFYRGAIEELAPPALRDAVAPSLQSLSSKELIRQDDTSHFVGQEAYRFLHIVVRDAAYQGLLKRTRAELHEAFVDWLERGASTA